MANLDEQTLRMAKLNADAPRYVEAQRTSLALHILGTLSMILGITVVLISIGGKAFESIALGVTFIISSVFYYAMACVINILRDIARNTWKTVNQVNQN